MGLDMYLFKTSRLSKGMDILYSGQALNSQLLDEIGQKYSYAKERYDTPRKTTDAIKKVATKAYIIEKCYKPSALIEKFRPDIDMSKVIDFNNKYENEYFVLELLMDNHGVEKIETIKIPENEYSKFEKEIKGDIYIYNEEKIYYWRKANQIREWFVRNLAEPVENCCESEVTKENLEKLLNDCATVIKDLSKAKEILPTSEGFFFGSTNYDECYYEELRDTHYAISQILKEIDWNDEAVFYYEYW